MWSWPSYTTNNKQQTTNSEHNETNMATYRVAYRKCSRALACSSNYLHLTVEDAASIMHFICRRSIELRDPNYISRLMGNVMAAMERNVCQINPIIYGTAAVISLVLAMNGYRPYWGHLCALLCLLQLQLLVVYSPIASAQGKPPYYVVAASGSIFSGRPYGVVFAMFSSQVAMSCEVRLVGPGLKLTMQMHISVSKPVSSYIFNIPELQRGNYQLRVKGMRGVGFTSTTALKWHNFNYFIKIQTTKAVYRPREQLQFRVYFHSDSLQPVQPEFGSSAWVEDANGVRIKTFRNLLSEKGVFEGDIQISPKPMLGTWRICAQNGNRMREQCSYVKIEDYELPIFDVTVQAPTELFLADKELKLNVSASYYIGMPVMGEATLNIETFSEQADASESLMMKKSLELSKGLVAFSFALNDFKTLIPNNQPLLLLVTAEVEEKLTKLRVNSTASITLWEKVFPDNGDSKKKRMARCKSATKCKKNELNGDELSSEISADIKPKPRTKAANHMTLNFGEVLKEPTFVTFEFDVKMKYAVCVIMFNGRILAGKKLVPENDGHNFKISIDVTTKTWPFVHVFVFGMETGSSELILSAKTINVKRKHHTHTEIKAPAVVRPGEDVTLEVRSPAKSYMGLMGINSRVMQIGDGAVNDFSKEFIDKMKELIRGHLPGKLAKGNLTAHKLGIVTLTNALTVVDGENSPPAKITPRHMPQSYVRRPLKWNPLLSRMPSKFNDVWIFKSIPDTKAGWHKIIARVPDAIANWRFTAFTVDPDVGLTILHDQPFVDILSTKPLFMNAKLPKTLKLGEILAIPLTCFNHYTQDLNVTVRLRNDASKFELLDSERKPLPESEYTTQHFILLQNATNLVTMYLRGLQLGVIHLNFTATAGVHQDAMSDSLRIVETGHILNQQELVFQTLGTKNKDTSWEAQIQLKHQHSGNGVECLIANNMVIAKIFTERPYSELDNTENLISKLISYYNIWSFMRERSIEYKQWLPHMEEQLNNGYQLLLHLRNSDGGFAYYAQPGAGAGASCSSTWLTAFALQAFQLLQKTLVLVDEKFILDCEKFLLNRLRNSSHYVELCETPGRRPLEVLELTMEVQKILQLSSRLLNLQMTQRWINDQMRSVHDNHLKVKRGLESIEWSPPKSDELNNWEEQRRQIETAGRLLNIQMRRKSLLQLQANSIYKWLIKYLFGEDNDANCYECAIAEQAIFAYLRTKISLLTKLNVELWTDSMPKRTKLSFTNANRFQPVHLPFQTKNQTIKLMAKGRGDLLVRCTFDYEVNDQMEHSDDTSHKHEPQLYSVTVNQTGSEDLKNTHQVTLEVCVERKDVDRKNYIGTELEIQLPTGYELKHGAVKTLLGNPKVRQAAAGVDNTNLFVELLTLAPEDSICLAVSAVRVHTVENLQSGKASAFDINILREPDTFGYTIKV